MCVRACECVCTVSTCEDNGPEDRIALSAGGSTVRTSAAKFDNTSVLVG